ncbi:MAG TPA: hypothetical protein VN151_08260, partial [Terracidiphilus sp.]|nr:hypothetical protein [Terracidiphilus sp.]
GQRAATQPQSFGGDKSPTCEERGPYRGLYQADVCFHKCSYIYEKCLIYNYCIVSGLSAEKVAGSRVNAGELARVDTNKLIYFYEF